MTEPGDVVDLDGVRVCALEGEIDFGNVAATGDRLRAAVPNDAVGLVVDLSAVRHVDSAGVQMLFEIARQLDQGRQGMAVALPETSPVRRLFAITHVEQVAVIGATAQECAQRLRSGGRVAF